MNSKFQHVSKSDKNNSYEALETINNLSSNDSKEISTEQAANHINLEIEKDKIINGDFLLKQRGNNAAPRKIGNLHILKYDRHGDPLIAIGPHWPFYICLSITIFSLFFMYIYFLWNFLETSIKLLGILIYLLQITAYTSVFLINPGIPKNFFKLQIKDQLGTVEQGFKFCDRCKIMTSISLKTNHCCDCDVCIVGYDHHCPWTSKCIGKGNILQFYAFVTTTMLLFGYLIFAFSMSSLG